MLSNILSTATLVVVAWLSVQVIQTQQDLKTVQGSFQESLQESIESVRADLSESVEQSDALGADVLQRMNELSAEQAEQAKQAKIAQSANKVDPKVMKAKDQAIAKMKQTASLQGAVVKVFQADALSKEKQGEKASELLLSTKSTIWKLSDKVGKSKDAMRGLMAPIDILASKWKRGDFTGDTKAIQKILQEVLATQTKS